MMRESKCRNYIPVQAQIKPSADGSDAKRDLACYVCGPVPCGKTPQPCSLLARGQSKTERTAGPVRSTKSVMRHIRFAFHIILILYI